MKLLVELGADLNVSQIGLARRLLLIHFRDSILQALSAGPLALVQASPLKIVDDPAFRCGMALEKLP